MSARVRRRSSSKRTEPRSSRPGRLSRGPDAPLRRRRAPSSVTVAFAEARDPTSAPRARARACAAHDSGRTRARRRPSPGAWGSVCGAPPTGASLPPPPASGWTPRLWAKRSGGPSVGGPVGVSPPCAAGWARCEVRPRVRCGQHVRPTCRSVDSSSWACACVESSLSCVYRSRGSVGLSATRVRHPSPGARPSVGLHRGRVECWGERSTGRPHVVVYG